MIEIHICPIKGRAVLIQDNHCNSEDEKCNECPFIDKEETNE